MRTPSSARVHFAGIDASSPQARSQLASAQSSGRLLQAWQEVAADPNATPAWWASQGLDLVATLPSGWDGLFALLEALGPRLTREPDLLSGLLGRLATPGTFNDRDMLTPGSMFQGPSLGVTVNEWGMLAQYVLYGPYSHVNLFHSPDVAPTPRTAAAWTDARSCYDAVAGTYRHGLFSTSRVPLRHSRRFSPSQLVGDPRSGLWPELVSVEMLVDVGLPAMSVPGGRLLAEVARWRPHYDPVVEEEMARWLSGQLPAGARLGDALGLAGDVFGSGPAQETAVGEPAPRVAIASRVKSSSRRKQSR